MNTCAAIILCGGNGKRMKSPLPKVLHEVNGIPMVVKLILKCVSLKIRKVILVTGLNNDRIIKHVVESTFKKLNLDVDIHYQLQVSPMGTGNAAIYGLLSVKEDKVLVLCGDAPLIKVKTLRRLINQQNSMLVSSREDPSGYGRIVRVNNKVKKIVEHKDCNKEELMINLVNCGTYCINTYVARTLIPLIGNDNKQNEFYLTDIVELYNKYFKSYFTSVITYDTNEVENVNSKENLDFINTLDTTRTY